MAFVLERIIVLSARSVHSKPIVYKNRARLCLYHGIKLLDDVRVRGQFGGSVTRLLERMILISARLNHSNSEAMPWQPERIMADANCL
jgi:hypothetical protein